ncbi:MAG TPA: amidase [Mycobacteriales bacterium]|nr:amidase [Mycobacteriales bacterium]
MTQLHDMTALEQAAAVRARDVSPVELVDHYLARIEELNESVGAFITVTPERAREQAAVAAQVVVDRVDLAPLHGVPTAIKDLQLTAGIRTTLGSAVYADYVPPVDDHVVTLLRRAGTISLGKTNTPEFGLPCYTEPEVAPPARTPWDLSRSAGGSSGGAAAAVAAGLVPFAQGGDGAGSIRIPASVCGLYGIKVSSGRVSNGPVRGDVTGLAWCGPLARTVRDAAVMLDAMAVPMPGDPHWPAPPASGTFLAAAGQEPGPLRIGRSITPVIDVEVDPECLRAYDATTALLASLGHDVVDVAPPFDAGLKESFITLWSVLAAGVPVGPADEHRLRPLTRVLRERGKATSAPAFTAALSAIQHGTRLAIAATAHCDVVLTPTLAQLPRAVGSFRDDADPWAEFDELAAFTPFTAPYNATGQPAVNVPIQWTDGGLPVGVQLVGRPHDEATLISLSAQLEAAQPWVGRSPLMW